MLLRRGGNSSEFVLRPGSIGTIGWLCLALVSLDHFPCFAGALNRQIDDKTKMVATPEFGCRIVISLHSIQEPALWSTDLHRRGGNSIERRRTSCCLGVNHHHTWNALPHQPVHGRGGGGHHQGAGSCACHRGNLRGKGACWPQRGPAGRACSVQVQHWC